MEHAEIAPVLECRLTGGTKVLPGIVDDLLGVAGSTGDGPFPTPETLEILGLALIEVLHTVTDLAGEQTEEDEAGLELWIERNLIIVCLRFSGKPLPDWLLSNWDRAREPAVLAPSTETGWGWLLVREALDSVTLSYAEGQQILFLEKRL